MYSISSTCCFVVIIIIYYELHYILLLYVKKYSLNFDYESHFLGGVEANNGPVCSAMDKPQDRMLEGIIGDESRCVGS